MVLSCAATTRAQFEAAVLEFEPALGKKSQNIERLEQDVRQAFEHGAKLVVTPEMATTGYHFSQRAEIADLVETIPGPTTERLQRIARHFDGYVVVSLPERDARTDLYYIAAAVVGPDGVLGKYRKSHLWQQEEFWAARGNLGLPVFDTPLGRIGILICMDIVFAETSSVIAAQGADILVVPTNSSAQTVSLMQGIAALNRLHVVGANRAGTEKSFHMPGASGIWGPDGRVIARSNATDRVAGNTRFVYGKVSKRTRAKRRRVSPGMRVLASYAPMNPDRTREADWGVVDLRAVQMAPSTVPTDNATQIDKQLARIARSRRRNSAPALVVFPELALSGPVTARNAAERATRAAELLPSIEASAKKHRLAVLVGTLERSGSTDGGGKGAAYANAAVLIDARGKQLGIHRKTLPGPRDRHWLRPGAQASVFTLPGVGRVGVLIGEEARSPLLAATMGVRRVDVVAVCESLSPDETSALDVDPGISKNDYPANADVRWDALARFSQATTVVANWSGEPFFGASGIYGIDPIYGLDKTNTATGHAPAVVSERVDLRKRKTWWFNQQHLITLRRPELYTPLFLH